MDSGGSFDYFGQQYDVDQLLAAYDQKANEYLNKYWKP